MPHQPTLPGSSRLGLVMPMEGSRWSVSLCVNHGETPPSDIDGFMAFAKSLRMPKIDVARQHLEDLAFKPAHRRRRWLFGMSLAHVMRQTRGVGDEERGHWLMSCLPNAPPLSLRGTFAPVRGKVLVITPHWLERLGFATQVFGLRLSIPVEARGFAEDKHHERKPSEGVTPALTQINARNAAICDGGNVRRGRKSQPLKEWVASVRAAHGQKPSVKAAAITL